MYFTSLITSMKKYLFLFYCIVKHFDEPMPTQFFMSANLRKPNHSVVENRSGAQYDNISKIIIRSVLRIFHRLFFLIVWNFYHLSHSISNELECWTWHAKYFRIIKMNCLWFPAYNADLNATEHQGKAKMRHRQTTGAWSSSTESPQRS